MKRSLLTALLLLSISSTTFWGAIAEEPSSTSNPKETKKMNEVLASDLIKNIKIIGQLGTPLGTMVKVRGRWKQPPEPNKSQFPRFYITQINDKVLNKEMEYQHVVSIYPRGQADIEINSVKWDWSSHVGGINAPTSVEDQEWELIGVETGRVNIYPSDVMKEAHYNSQGLGPHAFITELRFIRMRVINAGAKQ